MKDAEWIHVKRDAPPTQAQLTMRRIEQRKQQYVASNGTWSASWRSYDARFPTGRRPTVFEGDDE